MLRAVRQFFAKRSFLEVDTPVRVLTPGLEVHIDAVSSGDAWLITSPEMQMKRLLGAGLERIFTICKCFRNGEQGAQHNPEFTMLEWYQTGAIDSVLADTQALVSQCAVAALATTVLPGPNKIDVSPPWSCLTVREVFAQCAGITLQGNETESELASAIAAANLDTGTATAWDDLFYTVFVNRVEPWLAAQPKPTVLMDWPVRLAALAKPKPDDPSVVERFEVYVGDVELANAFGELTDAAEQRRRFQADQTIRAQRDLSVYPIDQKFLAALEQGIPESAGIALGIDRLVMLICGARQIRDVLTFSVDEL